MSLLGGVASPIGLAIGTPVDPDPRMAAVSDVPGLILRSRASPSSDHSLHRDGIWAFSRPPSSVGGADQDAAGDAALQPKPDDGRGDIVLEVTGLSKYCRRPQAATGRIR